PTKSFRIKDESLRSSVLVFRHSQDFRIPQFQTKSNISEDLVIEFVKSILSSNMESGYYSFV
ncbi:hypothetical protein GcM3_066004, partial [Golovinomyces cichoracearum]